MEKIEEIKTLHDTVLKCRLIFFDIVHELLFEGPCRFGEGMQLGRILGLEVLDC